MRSFSPAELIVNPDGSIYHLQLRPDEIADIIITVGDQDRVEWVTRHLDSIEFTRQHREFKTQTGQLGNKRITVISTGIGHGNIDIVLHELDALANIDLNTRQTRQEFRRLHLIRMGTSGTLLPEIQVGQTVVSRDAIGLDNLQVFYKMENATPAGIDTLERLYRHIPDLQGHGYFTEADPELIRKLSADDMQGTTVTSPGFYAPQGRNLRLDARIDNLLDRLQGLDLPGRKITNFEMETAAIYGLSQLAGHAAISFSAILANRANGTFHSNPGQAVGRLIESVMQRIDRYM